MNVINRALAGAAVFAFTAAAMVAAPAAHAQQTAQNAGEIMLSDKDIPWEYTELGTVSAVFHKKAIISKLDPETEVNKSLRAQASALGADAVVMIKYNPDSIFNKNGFSGVGKAVKFAPPPQEEAAAPEEAGAPQVAEGPQEPLTPDEELAALVAPHGFGDEPGQPAVPSATAPRTTALPARPSGVAVATGTPSAPVSPRVAPAVRAALPPVRHAVTEDMIILSELDVPNRRYEKLGEVSAQVKRTAAYMPKPMRTLLNDKMRADALKMGADAVIMIKYELPGVWSKERNYASGIAVKFK